MKTKLSSDKSNLHQDYLNFKALKLGSLQKELGALNAILVNKCKLNVNEILSKNDSEELTQINTYLIDAFKTLHNTKNLSVFNKQQEYIDNLLQGLSKRFGIVRDEIDAILKDRAEFIIICESIFDLEKKEKSFADRSSFKALNLTLSSTGLLFTPFAIAAGVSTAAGIVDKTLKNISYTDFKKGTVNLKLLDEKPPAWQYKLLVLSEEEGTDVLTKIKHKDNAVLFNIYKDRFVLIGKKLYFMEKSSDTMGLIAKKIPLEDIDSLIKEVDLKQKKGEVRLELNLSKENIINGITRNAKSTFNKKNTRLYLKENGLNCSLFAIKHAMLKAMCTDSSLATKYINNYLWDGVDLYYVDANVQFQKLIISADKTFEKIITKDLKQEEKSLQPTMNFSKKTMADNEEIPLSLEQIKQFITANTEPPHFPFADCFLETNGELAYYSTDGTKESVPLQSLQVFLSHVLKDASLQVDKKFITAHFKNLVAAKLHDPCIVAFLDKMPQKFKYFKNQILAVNTNGQLNFVFIGSDEQPVQLLAKEGQAFLQFITTRAGISIDAKKMSHILTADIVGYVPPGQLNVNQIGVYQTADDNSYLIMEDSTGIRIEQEVDKKFFKELSSSIEGLYSELQNPWKKTSYANLTLSIASAASGHVPVIGKFIKPMLEINKSRNQVKELAVSLDDNISTDQATKANLKDLEEKYDSCIAHLGQEYRINTRQSIGPVEIEMSEYNKQVHKNFKTELLITQENVNKTEMEPGKLKK